MAQRTSEVKSLSEQKNNKNRILLYIFAVIALAVIVWIIFRGTNVFNYIDRANETQQQTQQELEE